MSTPTPKTDALFQPMLKELDDVEHYSPTIPLNYAVYHKCIRDAHRHAVMQEREIQALQRWKSKALQVESEWDEQKLAKLLGGALGQSCRKIIAERVPEVLEENERLKKELAEYELEEACKACGGDDESLIAEAQRSLLESMRREIALRERYDQVCTENARLEADRENWRVSSVCRELRAENERLQGALRRAVEWDSHDSEGVPAVWLEDAQAALTPIPTPQTRPGASGEVMEGSLELDAAPKP